MKTPHTGTHRGTRVLIRLKDGERIVDKFHERTKKYVMLESGRQLLRRDIKSFAIYKGMDHHKPQ